MNDLYDINFQSNSEFCEIRIRYNVIHDWSTVDHLKKWSILEFTIILNVRKLCDKVLPNYFLSRRHAQMRFTNDFK
jgi:hypothetical protein